MLNLVRFIFCIYTFSVLGQTQKIPEVPPQVKWTKTIGNYTLSDPFQWMKTVVGSPIRPELQKYVNEENLYSGSYFNRNKNLIGSMANEIKLRKKETVVESSHSSLVPKSGTSLSKGDPKAENEHLIVKFENAILVKTIKASGQKISLLKLSDYFEFPEEATQYVKFSESLNLRKIIVQCYYRTFYHHFIIDLEKNQAQKLKWPTRTAIGTTWLDDEFFVATLLSNEWNLGKSYRVSAVSPHEFKDLIYENKKEDSALSVSLSLDSKYLIFDQSDYMSGNVSLIKRNDFSQRADFEPRFKSHFIKVEHFNDKTYYITNNGTPYVSLYTVDDVDPRKTLKLRIKGSSSSPFTGCNDARDLGYVNEKFIVLCERTPTQSKFYVFNHDFKLTHSQVFGDKSYHTTSLSDQSKNGFQVKFLSPLSAQFTYEFTPQQGFKLVKKVSRNINLSKYATYSLLVKSKNNYSFPVILIGRKESFKKKSPVYLTTYGSYGIVTSLEYQNVYDPSYSSVLMDQGVIVALALVRGGGEFGLKSYIPSAKEKRLDSVFDFLLATYKLRELPFVNKDKIVVYSNSAGGITVGSAFLHRPDFYKGIVLNYSFIDLIHTELAKELPLTALEWPIWGNPLNPKELGPMFKFSPYDLIREKKYPAILLNTAIDDYAVSFHEAAKFSAKVRLLSPHTQLYLNTLPKGEGGHGGSHNETERDIARSFTFVLDQMGLLTNQ